jgi:hypothetical protein
MPSLKLNIYVEGSTELIALNDTYVAVEGRDK